MPKPAKPTSKNTALPAPPRPSDSSSGMNVGVVLLMALFFGARFYSKFVVNVPVTSTHKEQPLYIRVPGALAEDKFHAFQSNIFEIIDRYELASNPSLLSGENFGNTRGVVLHFNNEGLDDLEDSEYNINGVLKEYFKLAHVPNCNAFVMNILICYPQDGDELRDSVGFHIDNTLAVDSPRLFFPYQVSAYYVQVPDDIKGGELELISYENSTRDHADPNSEETGNVEAVIAPQENLLVGFRGDAVHRVNGFRSAYEDKPRVSIVLENYYVGPEHYNSTLRWGSELKQRVDSSKPWYVGFDVFSDVLVSSAVSFGAFYATYIALVKLRGTTTLAKKEE